MNKNRFEAFSDGVFAIVITLLALELRPFEVASLESFVPFLPKFLLFVLSFLVVAILWINHHQNTHAMKSVDMKILWVNNFLLLFVTLIPFATSLLGENFTNQWAMAFYGATTFLVTLCFYIFSKLAYKNLEHFGHRRFIGIGCYGLAMVMGFANEWFFYLLLMIPPLYYFIPVSARVKK